MADKKDDDVKEEMPVAEPEKEEAANSGDADTKEEEKGDDKEKKPMFERIPKPDPGECWADQYTDKKDPRGQPDEIPFKWDKNIKEKKQCDTLHMLYLIQLACDLHRRRVIERNKYFTSISRSDRYIAHVDGPQIVTNFLKWHNEDKEKNIILGEYLTSKSKLFMINEMISEIGGVKKGPATRIYAKLKKEVMIEHDTWTDSNTKLKLETWGMKKIYTAEKVLEECTVDDIVTLFTYRAEEQKGDDEKEKDKDAEVVDGVFAQFEAQGGGGLKKMETAGDWKTKIVEWIREYELDGEKITNTPPKQLTPLMRSKLIPDEELNDKGKPKNKQLTGPTGRLLTICKKLPVHKVLTAAAAASGASSDK